MRQNIRINFERKRDLVANCSFLRFNGAMKKRSNKIRDLFKVKLYAIRSETKKKRERIKSVRERERKKRERERKEEKERKGNTET